MSSDSLSNGERQKLLDQYAEIATLAGGLAHEIRNPLSTITLNLELMAEDMAVGETPRERRLLAKIHTVQKACKNLQTILDDFLQFVRAGELRFESVDLNTFVEEFLDFFRPTAQEHGIELSPHFASDLPLVQLDRTRFRQVLMNLALNAQQAMPNGGLLELQTHARDGKVHLEIIDTGTGMSPSTLGKLFQVFFSTKTNGSGLGLPTARKIIEAHQGTITCDSEQGKGTRFTIILPSQSK